MKAHWVSVGQTTPAAETPIEVQPSACPRLVTNHLETVTDATRNPAIAAPVITNTPRRTKYCQYSSTWLVSNSAGIRIAAPTNMIGRDPNRSIRGPSSRPTTIRINWPTVSAKKNWVRDQSN